MFEITQSLGFVSGVPDVKYYAKFQRGQSYTTLHIHFSDYEENKNFFDIFEERKSVINAKFDGTVYWNRRDDIKICIIGFGRDGDIESDTRTLESIRAWHVENLLKFKEVFTPEIQRAHETLQSR